MPRISHQVFDSKGPRRGLVQRACQALGWPAGQEDLKGSVQQSVPDTGNETVRQTVRESDNEAGQHHGFSDGLSHVDQHGADNGLKAEPEPGPDDGRDDGPDYGFRIARVGDTLIDLAPGEEAPPNVAEHAQAFLLWLQGSDLVEHWARRSLLEKLYIGPFLHAVGWPAESWQTVAGHFRKLSGVKVRNKDLRVGAYREGKPTTVTEYWLPKHSVAVVKLAERQRAS
jgi:hypothetical protein